MPVLRAAKLGVPFLEGFEKALCNPFIQGLELVIRILLVRTFPRWGRHLSQRLSLTPPWLGVQ